MYKQTAAATTYDDSVVGLTLTKGPPSDIESKPSLQMTPHGVGLRSPVFNGSNLNLSSQQVESTNLTFQPAFQD